jgi:hypothetical protein
MLAKINWTPNARDLRKFGIAMIVGFAVIAGLFYLRGRHTAAEWLFGIGGGIGLLALVAPPLSRPFYIVWMGIAFVMGTITSAVILTVIFFLLLTPIAFLMRLFGRDALRLRPTKNDASYWSEHPPLDDKSYYERLS